jgi:exportin-T
MDFNQIVSKGMKGQDKLNLFCALNVTGVFCISISDQDIIESMSKFLNTIGLELCECVETNPAQAVRILNPLLNSLFQYLSNEYDDVTCNVIPFASAFVQFLKKQSRASKPLINANDYMENLRILLGIVITKMKYDHEEYESMDEEEEGMFLEMRKVSLLLTINGRI